MLLLSSAKFFKIIFFFKKSFRSTFRVLNRLDPDQDRHFVSLDLGPTCLQRLYADDKSHRYSKERATCEWPEFYVHKDMFCSVLLMMKSKSPKLMNLLYFI